MRTAVLISGNGSNLQALMDACAQPGFPAEISLVISNKAEAYGLVRAGSAGIQTRVISHKDYPDREAFDRAMSEALMHAGIEFICMAGFMRLLSPWFVDRWHNRLINIHPSLLPDFKGMHAIEQAFKEGRRETGCTVHFVRHEMDVGPIIAQSRVPVKPDDTLETLTERVHAAEHALYPHVLKIIAQGKVSVEDERVVLMP